MAFSYVWEKTFDAARSLATIDAPLEERLLAAYVDAGLLALKGETDWGGDKIHNRWIEITDAVRTSDGDVQPVSEAIAAMTESERMELATEIFSLYAAIEREHGRRDPDF